jgi:glycosyltransferase involved in cell wall biosynthesis
VPLATRFHAISEDVASVMGRRLRIPEDRIQVVYRGRDPARLGTYTLDRRLRMRAALSIGTNTPVVLSVGRIDRQKGIDTSIEAFRRLVPRIPDALLLVAGRPGNASALVRGKAEGYPAVRLLGHRTDVPDLMCAADVLSFPSRWEGLGGTLIEAMALRLAVVASDIPPVREAFGNVRWPLVRPDDGQALAEGLVSVLESDAASETRKDEGERRFRQFFTADIASDRMASLYKGVLRAAGYRNPE